MRGRPPKPKQTLTAPPTAPRITLQALADKYAVSLKTVKRYKSAGIDVWNEKDFRDYEAIQAEFDHVKTGASPDTLELKLRKLDAETRSKESQAEMDALDLAKMKGELVSLDEAKEAAMEISAQVKAALKRAATELPPKLEGLTAKDMVRVILDYNNLLLNFLHDK